MLLLMAAAAAAAMVRPWGQRHPRRTVSAAVWTAALALAASAFLLLNLIELVTTGTVVDRHRDSDWAGSLNVMDSRWGRR